MPDLTMTGQYEDLARQALLEITSAGSIGELVGESKDDDGVITMRFASKQAGYPGWQWNVSLAHVDGYDPTVIEAELLPAEGALLAPDWVPWSDRLAEYKAAQEAAEQEAAAKGETGDAGDGDSGADSDDDADDLDGDLDDDDVDDDDDEDDDLDDDDEAAPRPVLHSGDLDGVDIDEVDLPTPDGEGRAGEADTRSDPDTAGDGGDDADAIGDEVADYASEDTEDR